MIKPALSLKIGTFITEKFTAGIGLLLTWILFTGFWDDTGVWEDEATWNDGV